MRAFKTKTHQVPMAASLCRSACIKGPLSHNNTVYMLETCYASVALSYSDFKCYKIRFS